MLKIALIILLLLSGCAAAQPLTNQQIIKLYQECKSAGMTAEPVRGRNGRIYFMQCIPMDNDDMINADGTAG